MNQPQTAPMPGGRGLSPEQRQKLISQGWTVYEDGSMVAPDGTAYPAMDSPNDFSTAGGYGPALGGVPATAPPAPPSPPLPGAAPDTSGKPFKAPQFDRHFATSNAPFPGSPGGIGGGPAKEATNPMGEAMPTPFDVPEVTPPLRAQPGPDLKAAASQQMAGREPHTFSGRAGRMQQNARSRFSPRRGR